MITLIIDSVVINCLVCYFLLRTLTLVSTFNKIIMILVLHDVIATVAQYRQRMRFRVQFPVGFIGE